MNSSKGLLAATSIAGALAAATALPDGLGFHPEAGKTLAKVFEAESLVELDEFSAIVDGQDYGALLGALELSIESTQSVTVVDTYVTTEDGRPQELRRTFDALGTETSSSFGSDFDSGDQGMSFSSDLEGSTVVFTLDEDGEYAVAFADEDGGDEDLLDGLEEDMDLRFLLPDGEVSEGDSWEVPVSAFAALIRPGGDLGLGPDDLALDELEGMDGLMDSLEDSLEEELGEILEGSCECTFAGMREVDGVELAEIELALEISSAVDIVELLDDAIAELSATTGEEAPFVIEIADLNVDIESEGVLLWDLEGGHLRSLELSSDGLLELDVAISIDAEGESHTAEISVELSLSMKHGVTTGE
jgi:hypothetical protein